MTRREIHSPEGVVPYLIDADEFIRFCERLEDGGKQLELWDGVIIEMPSEDPLHMRIVSRLTTVMVKFLTATDLDARFAISPHGSLPLGRRFLVSPDLMIIPTLDGKTLPTVPDVALAVEVSVTTKAYDFGAKLKKYAEQGVRELWIIDGEAGAVHVFREPGKQGYGAASVHRTGETIAPLFAGGAQVSVADLL